jgi:hypothetical protein
MPTIPLSPGETFVLSKKNNVPYIKSSTDSVEQRLFIRNDIQLTGSAAMGTTIFNNGYIELTNTNSGQDPYIVFKPSTVALQNFALGYDDSANRFSLCTGTALATTANRQIFHVHSGSRILHVDEGLTVTGSAQISNNAFDATTYSYVMTTASTGSVQSTTWSIPSATTDRMFYVVSEPQYVGANLTGTSPYLQITTEFTSLGYIAFHETNSKPQYNHSFLIPAGIACTVIFDKGATTRSNSGNLEWKGKSIKFGG